MTQPLDTTSTDLTHDSESASTGSMRAIVQDRYGDADVLRPDRVPVPEIGASEVLVAVHAAGVDRGTWHLMTGLPYLVRLVGFGLRRPKQPIPGFDLAGRVVAVGSAVTRFQPGDEVFGIGRGAFAEYAVAEEAKLVAKPTNLTFAEAATAAISGITALQALTDVGGVQAGQRVLVLGASGGVGSYAVQLAKALGATVTGVASTRNLELVRSLGADQVIDYTAADVTDADERYDLVLDVGGLTPLRRLRRVLTPTGTLVIVGGEGGDRLTGGIGRQLRAMLVSTFVSQRLTSLLSREDGAQIERLATFLAAGTVRPAIGRRYDLDRAADALRDLVGGRSHGKSVIIVRP